METSHKELYICAMLLLGAVSWQAWNLFYLPFAGSPLFFSTLLLLEFLGYVGVCLRILQHKQIDFMTFILFIIASLCFSGGLVLGFAVIYTHFGLIDPYDKPTQDSLECLYFSVITWTTVGFGDFRPTPEVRLYVAIQALTGVIFFSLFISTLVYATNIKREKEVI